MTKPRRLVPNGLLDEGFVPHNTDTPHPEYLAYVAKLVRKCEEALDAPGLVGARDDVLRTSTESLREILAFVSSYMETEQVSLSAARVLKSMARSARRQRIGPSAATPGAEAKASGARAYLVGFLRRALEPHLGEAKLPPGVANAIARELVSALDGAPELAGVYLSAGDLPEHLMPWDEPAPGGDPRPAAVAKTLRHHFQNRDGRELATWYGKLARAVVRTAGADAARTKRLDAK